MEFTDQLTTTFSDVADLIESREEKRHADDSTDDEVEKLDARIASVLERVGFTERASGGMYREVYLSPDYVVKFAYEGRLSKKENSAEIANCTRIKDLEISVPWVDGSCNGEDLIADIPENGYETRTHRWLVMERVEDTPNNVTAEIADLVQQRLADAGVHIDEIGPWNMGRKGGMPVVFDYAGT